MTEKNLIIDREQINRLYKNSIAQCKKYYQKKVRLQNSFNNSTEEQMKNKSIINDLDSFYQFHYGIATAYADILDICSSDIRSAIYEKDC